MALAPAFESFAAAGTPTMLAGSWIVDSGSACDIVSHNSLDRHERKQVTDLQSAEPLITANGNTQATKSIAVEIGSAGISADAIASKKAPSVLSLGKRCVDEGFSFRWDAGRPPVLTRPDGQEIVLTVRQNVPLLFPSPVSGRFGR